MKQENTGFKTSIGGQAVMEGVMMRGDFSAAGVDKCALAVRKPDGEIALEYTEKQGKKPWYRRVPFVRGIFNFVSMLTLGYRMLMRSVELSGNEEEPSEFEKKMQEKMGDKASALFSALTFIISMALALGLFMFLPAAISSLLRPLIRSGIGLTAVEGIIKIAIFVAYLAIISHLKEIRRLFEYHGAEHKTIFCYEHDQELTVENVMRFQRFHPRCGTSFLLIVLVISILVFSVVTWDSLIMRVLLKLILLPVVVGAAYEVIRFAGRHDNLFTRIISAPGLCLQRLTTREPDASEIEVAIAAMKAVIPENRADAAY